MSLSKMLHSRQRTVVLPLRAAPEGSRMHAWFMLSRLVFLWLVVTSVSGDGHADPPHSGAASAKFRYASFVLRGSNAMPSTGQRAAFPVLTKTIFSLPFGLPAFRVSVKSRYALSRSAPALWSGAI